MFSKKAVKDGWKIQHLYYIYRWFVHSNLHFYRGFRWFSMVLMPEFLLYLDGHDFPPFRIYLTYILMTNHL